MPIDAVRMIERGYGMSNDTDFELEFVAPTRALLIEVMTYLERKESRWTAWKSRGKCSSELLERVGAKNYSAVVTWGFSCGAIRRNQRGEFTVKVTTWANQNRSNMPVFSDGCEDELGDLIKKFPSLMISGTYQDEFGDGSISLGDDSGG